MGMKTSFAPEELCLKEAWRNRWWQLQVRSLVTIPSSVRPSSNEYVFMVSMTEIMQYPLTDLEIPTKMVNA